MKQATFNQIKERVINTLNTKLPDHLKYHSTDHTLYVLEKSMYIAQKEGITKSDLDLLKVAALYHDIGFIVNHVEHETISCQIARKELKKNGLSSAQIEKICGMIMATKIPQRPHNLLEQTLADADLEYLATNRFGPVSGLLYTELTHYNPSFTVLQWNAVQIDFISKHSYHTKYCKHYKEKYKMKNLNKLILETKLK